MTERQCNVVIGITVTYTVINWLIDQGLTVSSCAIICVLLTESVILWHYAQKSKIITGNRSLYRPNVSSGTLCMLLVPVTKLGEFGARKQSEDTSGLVREIWLSLAVVFVIVLRLALAESSSRWVFLSTTLLLLGATVTDVLDWQGMILIVLVLVTSYVIWKCLELVPFYLQKSFTFGELMVVLQLFTNWIFRMSLSVLQTQALTENDRQLAWFICILVSAVIIATLIVIITSVYSSLWHFVAVYMITAVVSLLFLQPALHGNPLLWFLHFVTASCTQILLLATWIILLAVTVVWTVIHSLEHMNIEADTSYQEHQQTSDSNGHLASYSGQEGQRSSSLTNVNNALSFTVRKVFHVFIVLVYIPGLILDSRLLLLASATTFGLFIVLEAARALHVPVIGEHLDKILRTFIDDRDQGRVFLTHIYLLTGMSLPLWISHNLFSSHTSSIELYSGVLSLGIGDTVACIAGRTWGRTYWPGTRKTLEGTLCSILSQVALVTVGSYLGIASVNSFMNAFTGVCLSALFEAFTDQIDNLMLPLVLYPFLCFS